MENINFNNLISIKADGVDGNISVGAHKGNVSITSFINNKLSFKMSINYFNHEAVSRMLNDIQKASPGTKIPFILNDYDADKKKYIPGKYLSLGVNEDKIYFIETKSKEGAPVKFIFKTPGTLNLGSEPMSDQVKSQFALQAFQKFWDNNVRQLMTLARIDYEQNFKRGGNNNNNNNSRKSNTSNSDDEYSVY